MKNSIFYIVTLVLIVACTSSPQIDKLELGKPISIQAIEYGKEIIMSNPLGIEIIENNLYIFQPNGENAALIMDIDSGNIINSWGRRGNGPGEFYYPIYWGKTQDTFYLHNVNRYQLRKYTLLDSELTLAKEIEMDKNQFLRHATVLENGCIVASVIYGTPKPLILLDKQLNTLINFGDIPDKAHSSENHITYSHCLSSYKNMFVAAMHNLGYIACYEQKGDSIEKKWEHYLEKPIYKGRELDRKTLKRGFSDVKMTSKYIFCVYFGKKWDISGNSQPETILVFNHEGKLLKNFHLDRSISQIAISNDEKTIYAISLEPDINVIKYQVEDYL